MGMKKKMLSATLCAVMVGSLAAPAFTVQAADDTLVYWSMWEATEPQGQVIQEAVDAYTEQTGVKVDLQFKGRTGNREALQPALDGGTQIDIFDEDIDRVNGMYGKYLLDLEDCPECIKIVHVFFLLKKFLYLHHIRNPVLFYYNSVCDTGNWIPLVEAYL